MAALALRGCLLHLASSAADLVVVDLEDLWGEHEPQNRPGTGTGAANWRRRGTRTLAEARRDSGTTGFLRALTAVRDGTGPERDPSAPTAGGGAAMSAARPPSSEASSPDVSLLSEDDLYWFNEGTHRRMGDKLGAHIRPAGGVTFAVWAPNATRVAVIGDFNYWNADADVLRARGSSGIWEGTAAGAGPGHIYKFAITTRAGDVLEKADPFARRAEQPHRGRARWSGTWPTNGATSPGCRRGARTSRSGRPSRSTRCTWAAGAAIRATRSASSGMPRWRSR